MKITVFSFALLSSMGGTAAAACMPPEIAYEAVRGRVYTEVAAADSGNPVKLAFHDDHVASLGRATDGHPGGRYLYSGDCHGRVKVYFESAFAPGSARLVLQLRSNDRSYGRLVDDLSDRVFSD